MTGSGILHHLGALPADTSNLIYRPGYLIESVGAPVWVAYGHRRLSMAYTGPLFQIRRDSDNAVLDIASLYDSWDKATALAFVGSGNGYVTQFYDQSGLGLNMVAPATTNQGQLIAAGVANPNGTQFNGTTTYYRATPAQIYNAGIMSVSAVVTASPITGALFTTSNAAGTGFFQPLGMNSTGTAIMNAKATNSFQYGISRAGVADSTKHWVIGTDGGTTAGAALYSNTGTTGPTTYTSRPAFTESTMTLGGDYQSGISMMYAGGFSEIVLWKPVLTTTQINAVKAALKLKYTLT